jgi:hypothetical protein
MWNDFEEPDEQDERTGIVFGNLSGPEQEALDRFYNSGQSTDRICSEVGISHDQFQLLKRYVKAHFDWLGSRQGAAEQEGEEEATREERQVDMNADDRVMLIVLNILPEGSHAMLERSCGESQSPSQTTLTADKFETVRLRIRPHLAPR